MIQTIKKQLKKNINVLLFDEVESTNNICKEIGKNNFETTLVSASYQTGGRGRLGRNFISLKDKGIYMSLLIKPNISIDDISKVTCVVGCSIHKVLKEYLKCDLYVKWVNDIYLNNYKVCGILTESKVVNGNLQYLIIGMGINLYSQEFPSDIIASSIEDQTNIIINKEDLIAKIVNQVLIDLDDINNQEHVDYFKKHMYLKNEVVLLNIRGTEHICKILDINENFELMALINNEIINISSGEILKVSKIRGN